MSRKQQVTKVISVGLDDHLSDVLDMLCDLRDEKISAVMRAALVNLALTHYSDEESINIAKYKWWKKKEENTARELEELRGLLQQQSA